MTSASHAFAVFHCEVWHLALALFGSGWSNQVKTEEEERALEVGTTSSIATSSLSQSHASSFLPIQKGDKSP